ncbi:MAG: hypothetical protein ACXVCT_10605 [Ktedonobacterales bacterium]
MNLDILDGYWITGDFNPGTQVFSSAAGVEGYVANNAAAFQTWLTNGNYGFITAVLDTGAGTAGVVRLRVYDSSQLQNGQYMYVSGVTGTTEANGFVQINKIDATHIDLIGTTYINPWGGGGQVTGAQLYATQAELWAAFNLYAQQAWAQGITTASTSVDLTLTAPLKALTIITETGTSKKVILPNMRSPRAPPVGYTFSVKNSDNSTKLFSLYKADGSTLVRDLNISDRLNIVLTDNSTSNGTFELDPPPTSSLLYSGWTGYTPTVTSTSGTITSVTALGNYKRIGKIVFVEIDINISSNGTGSGAVQATLPFTPTNAPIGVGVGVTSLAKGCIANAQSSPSRVIISLYDSTYPGASGGQIYFSIVYQTTDA